MLLCIASYSSTTLHAPRAKRKIRNGCGQSGLTPWRIQVNKLAAQALQVRHFTVSAATDGQRTLSSLLCMFCTMRETTLTLTLSPKFSFGEHLLQIYSAVLVTELITYTISAMQSLHANTAHSWHPRPSPHAPTPAPGQHSCLVSPSHVSESSSPSTEVLLE